MAGDSAGEEGVNGKSKERSCVNEEGRNKKREVKRKTKKATVKIVNGKIGMGKRDKKGNKHSHTHKSESMGDRR